MAFLNWIADYATVKDGFQTDVAGFVELYVGMYDYECFYCDVGAGSDDRHNPWPNHFYSNRKIFLK